MKGFTPVIIKASAGTGKTYRLSVEYISILLKYYGNDDFQPDNILVLTFTRKATAEIRERIESHLNLLVHDDPSKYDERVSLISAIRSAQDDDNNDVSLSMIESNRLLSVYQILCSDKQMLRVMTIDSFINNIFRNLIRPLRSIDSFEIDTEAPEKRIPEIMNSLMSPRLKGRIDRLLKRRINPSLDEYKNFFVSLIKGRWYYYLITKRLVIKDTKSLQYFLSTDIVHDEYFTKINNVLQSMCGQILQVMIKGQFALEDMFSSGFKLLLDVFHSDYTELQTELIQLSHDKGKLYKLLQLLTSKSTSNIYNGNRLRSKENSEIKLRLQAEQAELITLISELLIGSILKEEQEEILDIWGEVLLEYDKLIYRYKQMSYDDIAWFTFEGLYSQEPPIFDAQDTALATEFYQFLSHRSRFILIDEFQDTSLIQFNILKPIMEEVSSGIGTKSFGGIIVVGDEKQSIFGWRGGERDLLLNLSEIILPLGKVKHDSLKESWRSTPHIMNFVNSLFSSSDLHSYLSENSLVWEYSEVQSMVPKEDYRSDVNLCIKSFSPRSNEENDTDNLSDIYTDFVNKMVAPAVKMYPNDSIAILCRRGKELTDIQLILEKPCPNSVFEPSADLTQHILISPLIYWLKYLAFSDDYSLLSLLRSNYMMINASSLKEIVDALETMKSSDLSSTFNPPSLLNEILLLADDCRTQSYHDACLTIVNEFIVNATPTERDYLNIHAFLTVIREYEINNQSDGLSIPRLLQYLEDNRSQDFMRQRTLSDNAQVQLLTIHKSKGLQFDRVFVFYNLSTRKPNDYGSLNTSVEYDGLDYQNVSDFSLTLHYDKLVKNTRFSHLTDLSDKREMLEEMNTLYVAFTRAKISLNVYFACNSSKTWEEYYLEQSGEKLKLPVMLCNIAYNFMQSNNITPADGVYRYMPKDYKIANEETKESRIIDQKPLEIVPFSDHADQLLEVTRPENLKQVWLYDRANLIGDLAHEYLSQIYYNSTEDKLRAVSRCIKRYGSILKKDSIISICNAIDTEISGHNDLFANEWDKIFTEKKVWKDESEYRIDRMMVNTNERKILLVDFKTGMISDSQQLKRYRDILLELDWVKKNGYTVETRYIHLEI